MTVTSRRPSFRLRPAFALSSLAAAAALASCGKQVDGPKPVVTGALPAAVCQSQLTTAVILSGQGLSPLYTHALTTGKLELPAVTITQAEDLTGAAVSSSAPVGIPDDPAMPSGSHVRWISQAQMSFDVFPSLDLSPGLYDITVKDADGRAGSFPASLLAVPPPTLTKIEADLACGAKGNTFTLTGDFFIQSTSAQPTIDIGGQMLAPASMTGCRDLPGNGELRACTAMTVVLPSGVVPAGAVSVQVTNPDPVGCSSTNPIMVTLVPAPNVTELVPDLACAADGAVMVKIAGTGFLNVNGMTPTVVLGGATLTAAAAGCTPITGVRETTQTCTELDVAIPAGTAAGQPDLVVVNPGPADCSSTPTAPITIFDRPEVTSAVPDLACAADGTVSVKLEGAGFLSIDGNTPSVTVGGVALTSAVANCTTVAGPREATEVCTELAILIPAGMTAGQPELVVTNPSPVGCSSTTSRPITLFGRPVVASIVPDASCAADGTTTVAIKGSGFITVAGQVPVVMLGALPLVPTAKGCTSVPGPTEVVSTCAELDVAVPATAPTGVLAVSVTNPAPLGCTSDVGPVVTLFDRPTIASVMPAAVCGSAGDTPVVITGADFITRQGAGPSVKIGSQTLAATPSGCSAVPNTSVPTQNCTTLTVTVTPGSLTVGKQTLVVTNPASIGCASTGTTTLEITAPPILTAVTPSTVCAGAATVTLTGTNFASAATVTLNGVTARSVTVSADGTSAVADFGGTLNPGGPYDLTISNGTGCGSTKAAAVTVVDGPRIFFYDPSVAYNGISIQGTLHSSGLTGAVQSVTIQSGNAAPIPLSFSQDSTTPNKILAVTPKGTPAGTYDIQLRDTTSCPATLPAGLVVTASANVTLASPAMTPPFGWQSGSTSTTVTATSATTGFVSVPRLYLNPSNPGSTTVATSVGAVSFTDKTQLSAVVPAGLPVGAYDLIVVNPDGSVGVSQGAFTVTSMPAPHVETIAPGSVAAQAGQVVAVTGTNFRTPSVTLSCVDTSGAALPTAPVATVSNPTATSLTVTFDATTAGAACVVRVVNGDGTYGDFSAVVITNPAQNLYAAKKGPDLAAGRRAPVALGGDASNAARFLHVLGGDDGTGSAFATVETTPLSLLGVPTRFFTQRTQMNQPRAFAGGAQIGRFLYVAGGSAGGTALKTVERAVVLDPDVRDQVSNLSIDLDGSNGLGPGVWYYRVASVMASSDAFNPGGENLPSDPFPVRLPNLGATKLDVTLTWQADPNAAKYRIYRSPTAGVAPGSEQVIAEASASTTTYVDKGGASISTDTPLPIGSLGRWQTLQASLATPREGAGVSWGQDPADSTRAYLYVIGGRQNGATELASVEFLPITLGAGGVQTAASAFTPGTSALSAARWQLGASRATNTLSSRIPAGTTYVYALSGVAANGTTLVSTTEAAQVTAGGQLGAFTDLGNTLNRAGYATTVAGNYVFAFGGSNAAPDTGVVSGQICGPGVNACGPTAKQTPPGIVNWNAGQSMQVARYLAGGALSGAYIYIAGGVTAAGTPPTLTNGTEYRLW